MLQSLFVQNYAIIDEVLLDFGGGFNVITGETGAGKSILLGALHLIRGGRADTKVLYDQSKKCIVEASMEVSKKTLKELKKLTPDVELNSELKIRREIGSTGRSRAFLNGNPIKIQDLKLIASSIIEIHNQFDTLSFTDPTYQLKIIDAVANNAKILTAYQEIFNSYEATKNEIRKLRLSLSRSQEDQEYIRYQLEELEKVDLDLINKQEIESTYQTLSNAEDIIQILQGLKHSISESDMNLGDQIREQLKSINQYADHAPQLSEIAESLEEILNSIQDIESLANSTSDRMDASPERIQELSETLDHLNFLENKHKVVDFSELIALRDEYRSRSNGSYDAEAALKAKIEELKQLEKDLKSASSKLSKSRKKVIPSICKEIENSLHQLAMPNAQLEIWHEELNDYILSGKDMMTFAFTSNKGIAPQAINEVASGGELSRLALSIRSMIAELFGVPTLIFDEIDTGISGGVALKLGHILENISFSRQVLCITHSPQVASIAEQHFFVSKKDTDIRTITTVKQLTQKDRVQEIAKMLSDDPPSKAAVANAKELLSN